MKRCELCTAAATMYCESDSASLCWDCDAKVHSANFLVEKHSRSLLCHVCQSPTAWSASGAKLGRTISVCEGCVGSKVSQEREDGDSNRVNTDDDEDDDENDEESEDEEVFDSDSDSDDCVEDDDEDNQVVPLTWPPPPPSSSSSGDELSIEKRLILSKRLGNGTSDYVSDDEIGCSSSDRNLYSFSRRDGGVDCVDSLSCLKRLRTQSDPVQCEPLGTSSIVDSLGRLYKRNVTCAVNADAAMSPNIPAVGSRTAISP